MTAADRVLPHDLGAEAVVISECMNNPDGYSRVADVLAAPHFFSEANRRIFESIVALSQAGRNIEHVAVAGYLRDSDRLAQVGGSAYLVELSNNVPSVAHVEEYAKRIVAFARARELIATAHTIAAEGYGVHGDSVQEFIEDAERRVFEIAQEAPSAREPGTMGEIMVEVYDDLLKAERRGVGNVELPTGIVRLDSVIGGLGPSDRLTIVAARPSMGKTALATGWAENIADIGRLAVIFSLEMPRKQLGMRMACSRAGASVHRARMGWMNDRERVDFLRAQDDLRKLPIVIDDTPAITLTQMRAKLRRIQAKHGKPALVMVDYLQLMTPEVSGKGVSRDREIGSITAGLKRMSRELDCAIVLLSQLNRDCEKREDKRPCMADLRESGAIEQDADDIIFVYRDEWYHRDTEDKGIAELIIGKQRNGPTPVVRCGFEGKSTTFRNLHRDQNDETEAA
jgi:replicative DNA helicase